MLRFIRNIAAVFAHQASAKPTPEGCEANLTVNGGALGSERRAA